MSILGTLQGEVNLANRIHYCQTRRIVKPSGFEQLSSPYQFLGFGCSESDCLFFAQELYEQAKSKGQTVVSMKNIFA